MPGQTSPTLLNTTTLTYDPDTSQELGTTLGGGGQFWEQTIRLSYQMDSKNKFGIYYNNKKRTNLNNTTTTGARVAQRRVLLPLLRPTGPVVGAADQPSPARGRLLASPGNLGRQTGRQRHHDPLAVGITDNNPQSLVPGYVQFIQNYHGRVGATDTPSHNPNWRGNFNLSYVTGAHSFKTGFDLNGATRWANTRR